MCLEKTPVLLYHYSRYFSSPLLLNRAADLLSMTHQLVLTGPTPITLTRSPTLLPSGTLSVLWFDYEPCHVISSFWNFLHPLLLHEKLLSILSQNPRFKCLRKLPGLHTSTRLCAYRTTPAQLFYNQGRLYHLQVPNVKYKCRAPEASG